MNSWKWSKGEAYYKSARPDKSDKHVQSEEYDSQTNAIKQSLADYSEDNPFGELSTYYVPPVNHVYADSSSSYTDSTTITTDLE